MTTGGVFTQEFAHEFEAERGRFLRRRFLWYAGVVIAMSVVSTIAMVIVLAMFWSSISPSIIRAMIVPSIIGWVGTTLYIVSFVRAYKRTPSIAEILRTVYWLIVISGAINLLGGLVANELNRPHAVAAYENYYGAQETLRLAREHLTELSSIDTESVEDLSAHESSLALAQSKVDEADAARDEAQETVQQYFGNFSPDKGVRALTVGVGGMFGVFIAHFFACLFLPWRPKESLRPLVPLFFLNILLMLIYGMGEWMSVVVTALLSPLLAVPGLVICWFRYSRFRDKFSHNMLRHRYTEVRRELVDAQKIHESLFPETITDGPIRFHYHYEPMRQIGGDFLYTKMSSLPGRMLPVFDVAIIDVTGHGISAALTVNRLYGEIERQYAEHPSIAPGKLLTGLNSYIHNTLASHSVYATALCLRIDPNDDTLTWASAGHPPAFVRTVDSKIHQLNSTTLVLGACHGSDFAPHPETMHFGLGDVLIAYTDGAIEARSATGSMLRIEGLMGMVHSCRATEAGSIGKALVEGLGEFRYGGALDDTLFVEVFRPLDARTEDREAIMNSPASTR